MVLTLVNGKDYPIYDMENNPFMFETTIFVPIFVCRVAGETTPTTRDWGAQHEVEIQT